MSRKKQGKAIKIFRFGFITLILGLVISVAFNYLSDMTYAFEVNDNGYGLQVSSEKIEGENNKELFNIDNMAPGEAYTEVMTVKNKGTESFSILITAINTSEQENLLFNSLDFSIREGSSNGTVIFNGKLKDLKDVVLCSLGAIEYKTYYMTLGLAAESGNEYQNKSTGFKFVITAAANSSTPNSDVDTKQSNKKYVETPPPVAGLPDGTLIDRMAGYIALSNPLIMNEVKSEIELVYDTALQKNNSATSPRIYYWNADRKNWVALATYPVNNDTLKAVNDGEYKGWFVVFGVIQPEFSDTQKNWAEQIINRMNGLGLVEGYPSEDKSMLRTVLPEREVSYAEFTMLISRLLNIDIDDPRLPLISEEESRILLNASYTDGGKIPGWVLQAAGTLCKEKILPTSSQEFKANTAITRIEAAVMISKALNLLTKGQEADLSKFTDDNEIPDWAKGELVEGAMLGYPDGTFGPNGHLTRAEALTLLHRLFVEGLGW